MEKPTFVYQIHIATTPERLWEALTSGDFLEKYWYGRRFRTDWKVGSPVQTLSPEGAVDWDGKVLKFDPPRFLSYTFQILGFQKRSSRLEFEIEPQGKSVRLTLWHFDIEEPCVKGISEGWAAFASTLKSLLETGKPLELEG
jgi:uncharacterized protein YndB with AHSA1/START domain